MGLAGLFENRDKKKSRNNQKQQHKGKSAFPQDKEEYIAVETDLYPAGNGLTLVYNYNIELVKLLSDHLSAALQFCTRFRTLNNHIRNLRNKGWEEAVPGSTQKNLVDLIDQGLLLSKTELLNKMVDTSGDRSTPPKISTVGWITHNRFSELKRSVESYIENNKKHSRNPNYVVLDDSQDKEASKKTRDMLSSLASAENISMFYAGEAEKRKFAETLVQAGGSEKLPQEVVDFALFDLEGVGCPVGANRNALLLGTVGEMVLSTDDDEICHFAEPLEKKEGLELFSFRDPTDIRFYPDRKTLLDSVCFSDQDFLLCHENLLGRKISDCLALHEAEYPVKMDKITPRFAQSLAAGGGRVIATASGICGDSGMGSPRIILGLRGNSHDRVTESKSVYESALMNREVLRVAKQYTISEGALFMAGISGLDNRKLPPPFFPVQRNQDGIFATILRACFEDGYIGHLPLAVVHDPKETRKFSPEAIRSWAPRISDIIILLVQSFEAGPGIRDPEAKIEELGRYLVELGSMRSSEFEEFIKIKWLAQLSQYIDYLEGTLAIYNYAPDYWAEDVAAHIETVRAQSISDALIMPSDLLEGRSEEESKKLFQKLVYKFGELLIWWPEIVRLAKMLRAEGKGLLTQV